MQLPILSFPDARLQTVAKVVTADILCQPATKTLVDDMLETMYHAKGIGLAATQINVHQRIVVVDVSEKGNTPMVFINPKLDWLSDEKATGEEGCLSVPNVHDLVERSVELRLSYVDLQNQPHVLEANGLLAICIQHELDHLMGRVFVDYLSSFKRGRIATKLLKAQRITSKESKNNA